MYVVSFKNTDVSLEVEIPFCAKNFPRYYVEASYKYIVYSFYGILDVSKTNE